MDRYTVVESFDDAVGALLPNNAKCPLCGEKHPDHSLACEVTDARKRMTDALDWEPYW